MAEFLRLGASKIVLIAPTTGLVDQQVSMARERLNIDEEQITAYTGGTAPEKRQELWEQSVVVIATPSDSQRRYEWNDQPRFGGFTHRG